MILISTGTFIDQTAFQTAKLLASVGFRSIELSGGAYSARQISELHSMKDELSLFVHNYFPPPEKPFVFNLAAFDETAASISMKHALKAIKLSSELGNPVYSFHSGYLMDIQPWELGHTLQRRRINARDEGLTRFIERVGLLSEFAKDEGVDLLIENNVLSKENYEQFGCDPMLMSTPDECALVMKNTPENVNMLIDVGHLKVSANTLKYNSLDMLIQCDPWIKAYHLSDNEGTHDSNGPTNENSWFWSHLKSDIMFYSLEIKSISLQELKKQHQLTKQMVSVT